MNPVPFGIALAVVSLLGACASTDHSQALSLGTAGVAATQALSDQTDNAGQTVGQLNQWWGVGGALDCAAVSVPSARAACVSGATAPPDPALAAKVAQISDVIAKRKVAIDTLNHAYAAFVDLAKYNAGQEASAALATSFTKINTFLSAASALSPAGAAVPAISTTVQNVAGGAVALIADTRQNQQILAANKDLRTANDALFTGLSLERDATTNLLVTLQAEKAALGASALTSGMISPFDVVSPVLTGAFPSAHVTAPPPANSDVLMAAARNALADQALAATASAPKSYDDALAALHALSAQHQKLETKQPLDLTQIEIEIGNLQADIAQMNTTQKPAAK